MSATGCKPCPDFGEWLGKQCTREDPVGDLARDAFSVECCAKEARIGPAALRSHIYGAHYSASAEAIAALTAAEAEWRPLWVASIARAHEKRIENPKKRDEMPYALRFDVLARDEFTCVACGSRPGNEGLHVDHLLPWSLGGAHSMENLTTLCRRCNLGKGARVWIPSSLLLTTKDEEGFAIWKKFGAWNIEVCEDGVIANWPREDGRLWFGIERCWEREWISHLSKKCVHKGCDEDCREFTYNDFIGPMPAPGHPRSEKIRLISVGDLLSGHYDRDEWDRRYSHDMGDLSRTLDFMRAIYRPRRSMAVAT